MAKKRQKAKTLSQSRVPQPSLLSAQATEYFQQEIRKSPLWTEMVVQFGEEEATRLLQQFRLDIH